jgi:hypothetical protein
VLPAGASIVFESEILRLQACGHWSTSRRPPLVIQFLHR